MRLLIRAADAVNEIAGQIAAWLSVALVLLVAGLVAARYLFDAGSIAVQEAVLWLHGALFLLALGYALKHDAHVRVDVFSQRMTAPGRARIECLGIVLLLVPFCLFALWVSYDYVALSWGQREGSNSAGLPGWYLIKTLIPLSATLLLLQAMAELVRAWARAHPDREQ